MAVSDLMTVSLEELGTTEKTKEAFESWRVYHEDKVSSSPHALAHYYALKGHLHQHRQWHHLSNSFGRQILVLYHKALRRSFERGSAREFEQSMVETITMNINYLDNKIIVQVNTAPWAGISVKAAEDLKLEIGAWQKLHELTAGRVTSVSDHLQSLLEARRNTAPDLWSHKSLHHTRQRYYQALVAYHQELFTILQSDFEYAMYWLLNFVLLERQTMEDESRILEREGKAALQAWKELFKQEKTLTIKAGDLFGKIRDKMQISGQWPFLLTPKSLQALLSYHESRTRASSKAHSFETSMLQTVKEFKRSYEEDMKTKFVRHLDKEKLKVKFVKQLEEEEKAEFVIETAGDSSFFEDVHKINHLWMRENGDFASRHLDPMRHFRRLLREVKKMNNPKKPWSQLKREYIRHQLIYYHETISEHLDKGQVSRVRSGPDRRFEITMSQLVKCFVLPKQERLGHRILTDSSVSSGIQHY